MRVGAVENCSARASGNTKRQFSLYKKAPSRAFFFQSPKRQEFPQTRSAMCPSGSHTRPESKRGSDFRPAFDVLDADKDGKISRDDLRFFYTTTLGSANATEDDIGTMISVADSNNDGFVEFDEFERVLGFRKTQPENGVMRDVFRVMDKDGDGKVGFDDLKSYMDWAGFSASHEDIKVMIQMGGGDEKDGVGIEGLMKILNVDLGTGLWH